MRFFNRLGATEIDPDTVCNKAGHVALDYVYGAVRERLRPPNGRGRRVHPRLGRQSVSVRAARRRALARRGAGAGRRRRPDPNADGRSGADLHLQPFPGSDAALAFALLARDPAATACLDRGFLRDHTVGWEELEPHLDGLRRRLGRGRHGRPGGADRRGGAPLRGGARRSSGSARASSASATGGNVMRACAAPPGRDREPRPAGSRLPLPQRIGLARHRLRLPDRRPTSQRTPRRPGQPDGSRRDAVEDPARVSGARRLEHQHRGLEPGPGPAPPRARARGPVHGRGRSVPDRHRPASPTSSCRRRASSSSTTSSCSYFDLTLSAQVKAVGPARRLAAEPGDLPPAGARHGIRRARALRAGRAGDSSSCCAAPAPASTSRSSPPVARCRSAASRSSSSTSSTSRRRAGEIEIASDAGGGGRPAADAAPARRPTARAAAGSGSSPPRRRWLLNDSFANDPQDRPAPRRGDGRAAPGRRGRAGLCGQGDDVLLANADRRA